MTNIILNGCNGKMGRAITSLANAREDVSIVCGVDISPCSFDYPVYLSYDDIKEAADVVIDFSHPSAFDAVTSYCLKTKTPLIMCTTGLSSEQRKILSEMSKSVPVFFSANMSLGVNLITMLAKKAAEILCDSFNIEIVEKHHNQKIDAPSGTALSLAEEIAEVLPYEAEFTYDRTGRRCVRGKKEIGIHAVRGGNIVGDHSVIFAGNDEIVEISHHAASKEVFAAGAIKAATFMKNKPAGMYSMKELVNEL